MYFNWEEQVLNYADIKMILSHFSYSYSSFKKFVLFVKNTPTKLNKIEWKT